MTDNEINKIIDNLKLACELIKKQSAEIDDLKYQLELLSNSSVRALSEKFSKYAVEDMDELSHEAPDFTIGMTCTLAKDVLVYTRSIEDYDKLKKYIKAEAVREFADKLKQFICLEEDEGSNFREDMYYKIVELAKEMTEEKS